MQALVLIDNDQHTHMRGNHPSWVSEQHWRGGAGGIGWVGGEGVRLGCCEKCCFASFFNALMMAKLSFALSFLQFTTNYIAAL